jgi:itaconate CoA-transferase
MPETEDNTRAEAAGTAGDELPLGGLRVVALEQAVAAPLCTRHLVDLGADVVKIERPDGGDIARGYDSVVRGESAYFVWLNQGKRSVSLDLSASGDREVLSRLLGRADVFVHNLGPGSVDRLGFGWDRVHGLWPGLISCGISGYGIDGPYRDRKAFDLLLQGESGLMSLTGTPENPAKVGVSVADISAGMYALSSILVALITKRQTGVGTFIDISMLECLGEWLGAPLLHQLYGGAAPPRAGMRHNMIVPYGPYRVGGNALVNIAVQTTAQWKRFCQLVLEKPELEDDPRYATNESRVANRAGLEETIEAVLSRDSRQAVLARLDAADLPSGALNDLSDVVAHPQLRGRERWAMVQTQNGPVRALSHPMNIQGLRRRPGAVPMLGEHSAQVRLELELGGLAQPEPKTGDAR